MDELTFAILYLALIIAGGLVMYFADDTIKSLGEPSVPVFVMWLVGFAIFLFGTARAIFEVLGL